MLNFENLFLPGLLVLVIICTIFVVRLIMNWFIKDCSHYLNSLGKATTAQLRNEVALNQRYNLIKTLKLMKKYFGWAIILITLTLITLSTVVVLDSRDYFMDVFEKERQTLNLRSEASVDSLQTVIIRQERTLDSLLIVNSNMFENNDLLKSKLNESNVSIVNLQNVINHQNVMINNLRKNVESLELSISKITGNQN